MKSGKAVGPDDIPVEVWKCLGEAAVEFLANLFNRVLESERMPEEWRRSVLVPIFKNKGDVQSCSNYRGIKLMSHTMKLWERVVEARLRKVVDICEQQYGFMPRKSTTDAIFALRILMEKYRDGQKELHCVFVDLEKAYDRVPREELWYCMRKSGVAEKYVRVVQDMYERSRTVVRCAVGQTEKFNVEVGLHQGSALSPFLFAIVMDQLSEEVRQESPWTMMFADDIVICSESREQVEENLERWRFALERRGMKVSRSKTEYMCVNEREGSGTVRLQGEEVKKVQEFKYLGSTVQSNGECGKEVKKRVQAGWNGWRKVSGVLCDRKISARIKGKVYRTVVRPAMLYGLETVSLRKRQESELEVAELKMLSMIESIPTGERVVIGADFNGHVGEGNTGDEEVMGKFGVKERNLEGQMIVDFAKRMDMAVVNTYFQKREEHRVTYKSAGRRTQVDYILCRRGNLKEISDCKVVVGESVARQHRMVVCRMTLMVCKKKRSKVEIEKKTKWWKLKKEECCEEFRQKLRQALGGQVVLPDDWETTAEVIRETGRKVLGVSSGRRKEDKETWWWNEEVQDSIQRKRLAKKKWDMDRTEENRQEYKELQRRVKKEVSKAKQKAYDELYTRLDTREGEKDLYSALNLPGFQLFRADRVAESAGKSRGGGTCFYINERWCTDVTVLKKMCCPDLEAFFINCKPFYSPREFSSFILVSVYIPPQAHVSSALQHLADEITHTEQQHPDSVIIILGDFNKANLSHELPKFKQHISCPTRDKNILDHCYTTIKDAYRSVPRAALGLSDHCLVHLLPTYRPKLKSAKPVVRTVKRWTSETEQNLQACFECTDWSIFEAGATDLDELTETVTSYISFCEDMCIPTRTYLSFNNDKPWFTSKLRHLRQAKEDAFRNGDRVLYNQARNTLNKEIRVAKRSYAKKLENQFSANDPASVWKGLKYITNYKTPSPSTEANQQLAEDLNEFYCRFETAGLTPHAPSEHLSIQPLTPPATPLSPPPALRISEDDVRQIFLKQKKRKAPGPDGVTPVCLRTCADQLAFIFSQIFNRSLELCEVPACFKRSTIIPIPKKPKMTGFNDYRPVALTSVVMKSFERLVLAYLKNITGPLLDPLQFAYRANRSVDDAVNMGLHFILQHLDKSGTYVRLLFVDFSSAFNTIIPTLLQTKLTQLSVPSSICQWITSFLTDRHQLVKLGKFKSNSRTTSTGAPQGCVLSPLLFSLYTNDCTSTDPSIKLLKFADDTTVIGLIQDGDESAYRQEIEQLAAWCSRNNLELNTLKTVEIIVDFRRNTPALPPLTIMNSTVPTVASFRFLGTTISQDLKWDTHIDATIKKAQQRLYFLRQLRKFNLPQELLIHFYSAVIEDGRVLTSEESVQRRWKEYFEELMNEENEREKRVEGVNSVEQKVDKIRKDEVRKALKRMKSGKAVGPDDIPVEVWKCLGEAAVEFLASLFNRVLESERMPEEWRRSVLVPIFKNKGDVQSCSNYRGIKLMSHTMKVWERVVEARLRKVVEICEQQYGFMPRKSTTDAIFALRNLMEKYRDGQRELHCVFVDLEKAYDRVPREELWYCMRKSGVAEKYVRVVQDMYERSRTVVRCAVGQTEEFKVEVGLHQGSALSPFLFAIVMDQLSEEVRQESPWTMMFADDIVICSESREQVEETWRGGGLRWREEE
ncbi:hypothetical protein QTP86_006055 [Hemibagrus guttatus]|nr:hypothetical protein QTP86_006055 [Hemibagrus guttatus]